ncbi:guanylate kinase [Candidatus Venteria ishoeyi]|uniref:Guanylate kinase n=1 Tax=Candidatus Venteria ishoeyi TaxID=1899563 RepID=A0A1H6FAB7_9GAMM|nr:guanylate kinase [Candidatus Venteria ishoeyi]SEH07038.1 Guanylate kinase [Candidatus Venteria ishoeyi]
MQRGSLYIIAAPSGAGKTSLVSALIQQTEHICVSVSHTTRAPRPGEENGKAYFFVSHEAFQAMQAQQAFLEQAQVFDNHYGTSKAWVSSQLEQGIDVILEIDWQGGRQVREQLPESIGIFILPPSRMELDKRLRGRGQDSEEIIARRMRDAISEMSHHAEFDYLLINDEFDQALLDLQHIIYSQRLRHARQAANMGEKLEALLHS